MLFFKVVGQVLTGMGVPIKVRYQHDGKFRAADFADAEMVPPGTEPFKMQLHPLTMNNIPTQPGEAVKLRFANEQKIKEFRLDEITNEEELKVAIITACRKDHPLVATIKPGK